jgi:hypothetical protein
MDFFYYLPILFIQVLCSFAAYKLCIKKGYNKYLGIFIGFFLQILGLLIIGILPKKIETNNWQDEIKYNKSLSLRLFALGIIFFLFAFFGLIGGELYMFTGGVLLGIISIIISVKKDPTPSKLDPDMGKKVFQALGKCYSCQKKVSKMATKCPHCLVDLPTII